MKISISEVLREAYRRGEEAIPHGAVATYIPELGRADKNALGISLCTRDGQHYGIGQIHTRFTMQSISKVVTLIVALEKFGAEDDSYDADTVGGWASEMLEKVPEVGDSFRLDGHVFTVTEMDGFRVTKMQVTEAAEEEAEPEAEEEKKEEE